MSRLVATGCCEGEGISLRAIVGRVEVHASSVQLVLRARAIPGKPTVRAAMEAIRERLDPTEQMLIDPSHAGLIRILLPIRMVVRGGRTWLKGSDGRPLSALGAADPRMIKGLRTGHDMLRTCGIDPVSLDPSAWRRAAAPRTGRERWLTQLAFMAPDIQRAMLSGAVKKDWNDPDWRRIPLSWAAQREMFMVRSGGVPRHSTSQSRGATGLEHFPD